jgi:glycine/D-amino acid oxidase-like deaminating enzyme
MAIERNITRLPRDPGESGWNAVLTPAPAASPLQDDIRADWLVIGAGFAGLAAARELSLLCPGDRIAVLDAVRVAEGPAGRNTGFMIDLPHDISSDGYASSLESDIRQAALNRIAIDFAGQAAEEYGLSRECFDRSGKLSAAATAGGLRHNEDYARHLSKMGESHRLMNAAEIRDLTGTDYYQGALFTPGAVMIQPAMFMRAMAAGLAGKVSVFENSPVVGLANTGGQWIATTPAGSVTAPKAIMAVNGHAESFGFYRRRLMHIFTYASMTRALTEDEVARLGGAARWAATPADPMGTTVRRISGTGGERIIIRNRFTYDPTMEVGAARLAAVKRDHRQAYRARFMQIADVEFEYTWGGRLCLARNGVQAFGEVETGLFSACCQNGVGAAKGTLSGIMAARLATETGDPMLAAMLDQEKPRRLPPEPFAWIGANATIRWKEHRAGREF